MNRRRFLELGAIASTLPIFSYNLFPTNRTDRKSALLLDMRYAEAVGMAHSVVEKSFSTYSFTDDITQFWYEKLHGHWHDEVSTLGGFTGYSAMFCLEQLARDYGKRLIYYGEHSQVSESHIAHSLHGPSVMLRRASFLETADNWADTLARMLHLPLATGPTSARRVHMLSAQLKPLNEPMYSWLIASKI